jgi:hypothetical protein
VLKRLWPYGLLMRTLSRWKSKQTQSKAMCSWRAGNLGTRLLGNICTSGYLGQR